VHRFVGDPRQHGAGLLDVHLVRGSSSHLCQK
jgi:hypothetical protein